MINFNTQNSGETYQHVCTNDLLDRIKDQEALAFDKLKRKKGYGTTEIIEIPFKSGGIVAGDDIIPKLMLVNSYNRESSLKLILGVFRLVCANGLIAGDSVFNKKIKHRVGPSIRDFLTNFDTSVSTAITQLEPALEQLTSLATIYVDNPYVLFEKLLDDGVLTSAAAKHVHLQYLAYDRYDSSDAMRQADAKHRRNLWGIFNLVNEALRKTETSRTTYASSFERNRKLIPALLKLAA